MVTHRGDSHIYTGGSDGKIIRWNSEGGVWRPSEMVPARNTYQVYSMDINADETLLAAAGLHTPNELENYIELYSFDNMKAAPRKITGFRYSIENIHFTPDGKGLYARDNGGHSIKFSDFTTTKEVIKPTVKINSTDLRADGLRLAGAGNNGTLYIWDVRDNYKATEIKLGGSLTSVTWHPTEDLLVVGDNLGLIRLIKNGIVVRTLSGHRSSIEQIKYNHSATFFASASKDRTVRLWNVSKLTIPPIELKDHLDWVWTLTFSPDDEQIMVGLQSTQQSIDQDKIRNEASIRAYPTKIATMSDILCEQYIKENMSKEDWETYVPGLDYESTCPNYPPNNK